MTTADVPTISEAARQYINRYGWRLVPIHPGTKGPNTKDWQSKQITPDDVESEFINKGIGVMLGPVSGNLVDIDLDCGEARYLGPKVLPESNHVYTRTKYNAPSHYLYTCTGQDIPAYVKLLDPRRSRSRVAKVRETATIAELRYCREDNIIQSLLPPTVHPDGDALQWVRYPGVAGGITPDAPITVTSGERIARNVHYLGAVTLLARYWPNGGRQDAALALAGGLLRVSWNPSDIEQLLTYVCRIADDKELAKRISAIEYTANKIANGDVTVGWPALSRTIGEDVISDVVAWLGIEDAKDEIKRQTRTGNYRVGANGPANGTRDSGGASADAASADTASDPYADLAVTPTQLTDTGNANRFAELFGNDIRYVKTHDKWYIWNGEIWVEDATLQIQERAKYVSASFLKEAATMGSGTARDDVEKHALRTASARAVSSIQTLARSIAPIATTPDVFDNDTMLLSVANGTLNLRDQTLRGFKREDYLTTQAPIVFDPEAVAPRWLEFLAKIFGENQELIDYVQRCAGYSLTGETGEQCIFMLHGTGQNGKTVFINTLAHVLGRYAKRPSTETLLGRGASSNAKNDDIARLQHARFVYVTEPEEDQKLAEAKVKELTGGELITAKFMYGHVFEYPPTFKIWVGTNHLPRISGDDDGIWRRINLIPFTVRIPDNEKVERKLFESLLWEQASGILNWLLEGVHQWRTIGLRPPSTVTDATKQYRTSSDIIGQWLREMCEVDDDPMNSDLYTRVSDVYDSYAQWAKTSGARLVSRQGFNDKLRIRGLIDGTVTVDGILQRVWRGIRITTY